MVKRICDRCGKEITGNAYFSDVCEHRKGELVIELYRKSEFAFCANESDAIDLCHDCKEELKETIEDFLSKPRKVTDIEKAFAAAHECCGGCIE